ncbi:hypothetical protein NW768_004911 [Fusarium equiseti]|uniref:Uncharacterized protein n=1 Tax=Fusarium equiseti TaxID=61235 RepID=A0ABQ8RHL7_FUSEQ|nr:hypothetical protein NW768_004911 [Fusarium equiseti]
MAEALGVISSTITIWDLVCKLRKCCKRIKAAPAVWKEYCDKLESLSHVQSVLKDMMSGETSAFNGIKSKELATLAAKEIEIVGEQVNNILRSFDELAKSSRKRIWDWLRVKAASVTFVIAEEDLQGLIESAEKAKMSLQSAICLCGLETVNAGQTKMQEAFQILYDGMKEQAKALERLNRDKRLSKIPFSLVHKEEIPTRRPLKKEQTADTSRSKSKRSSRRRKKRRSFDRHGQSRTKARYNEDQNLKVAEGYEIVLRNNDVSIMATDTDEYKSAADGNETGTRNAGLEQIERKLESLSNDEWERDMGNHLYQFQLSPALSSENTLNTDLGNDTIPIIINADKQSRAFVGESTNLDQCVYEETDSMLFCISYICITETGQTFTIKEPCQELCRHIELQVMKKWLKAKNLPCMVEFKSISCRVSSTETNEIQSASSFTLECYHGCPHRTPCSYTILEDEVPTQEDESRQMIVADSNGLKAWLADSEQDLDTLTENPGDSDASTDGPGSTEDDNQVTVALLAIIQHLFS